MWKRRTGSWVFDKGVLGTMGHYTSAYSIGVISLFCSVARNHVMSIVYMVEITRDMYTNSLMLSNYCALQVIKDRF
jgi:hypothetical protein